MEKMRFLLPLSLPLGLLVSGLAQAASASYYPHTPGQRWSYASGETQIVGQPVTYRGVQVVPVNHQLGTVLVRQDLLEYRKDGSVWLRGVHQGGKLSWYAQPLNVYPPGPLRVGQSWMTGKDSATVTGIKAVKTGVGNFNALVIEVRPGGTGRPQRNAFVPTVGIVQFETAEGTVIPLVSRK